MKSPTARGTALFLLLLLGSATALRAEDTRRKWQFGMGFSYWSTDDNIRSNASTAYAPINPAQGGVLPPITFSDPRPDANELNEPTIQDNFKFDFNASFGLTRWFAVELGTSYFKGDVGDIEFYSEDRSNPVFLVEVTPGSGDPNFARCQNTTCLQMKVPSETPQIVIRNAFLPVGKITEVPVSLSGIVRFRPESPFDPYIGAGLGYIFTSLDTSASNIGTPISMSASDAAGSNRLLTMNGFDDVRDFTNGLIVQNIRSGARAILTYPVLGGPQGGKTISPLVADVEDGSEWHLMGGVDYYLNERFSIYIDGRYVWAQSRVRIRIDGQEQINSGILDHGCVNHAPTCHTLDGAVVDTSNVEILSDTADDIQDLILIQGGDIRLGGFSLGIGAKVTF